MENLSLLFNKRLELINNFEDAISIIAKKAEMLPKLQIFEEKLKITKNVADDLKSLIIQHKNDDTKRYNEVMNKLKRQQLIMLNIVEHIEEKHFTKHHINFTPKKNYTALKENININSCSSMYINDFLRSPFISKKKSFGLNFLDFNVQISQLDFEKLPKYMRGRETVDDVNEFLETVIIKCFNEKYSLVYKQRDAVRNCDRTIWNMYKLQESYFPGKKFITQGDVSKIMKRLLDKKILNRICMLRHLLILREIQHDSTICYIWNYNCA